MRHRIMGEEIEWTGGGHFTSGDDWISFGDFFDMIAKAVHLEYENTKNTNIFLPNGSRVYHETSGKHLETASPECPTALEVLKFDKWAEYFVFWISKALKEKYGADLIFFKKNSDSKLTTSRGCHENYFSEKIFEKLLMESEKRLRSVDKTRIHPEINYFILFLITRQIFTGSGGIMLYSAINGEDMYEISPRTNYINAVLTTSTTTTGSTGRSIINIRAETLTGNDKYWRNHLILGDANMADLSTFLKFGTTSAIIEMIEEGSWDERLCLDNPADAPELLKRISKDLTLQNVPIRLRNGKDYTTLQIQRKFRKNWRRHIVETNQGGEKIEIEGRWKEVLDRLEIDDEALYSQLDWKIKRRLIEDFMDKKGFPLSHKSIINIDNLYHNPDKEKGFYYKLKNRPGAEFLSLVSESEVLKADRTPPETRAKLRVTLKKIIDELDLKGIVDWHMIAFSDNAENSEYKHNIQMSDPRISSLSSLNFSKANEEAIQFLNSLKPSVIMA